MTTEKTQIITLDEVKKHNTRDSVWFIIHNKVYDVTKFIEEHPGGEEVLLEQAGKEASEIFEDVSHSADAKDLMNTYLVGELPESEKLKVEDKTSQPINSNVQLASKHFNDSDHSLSLSWSQWSVTVIVSLGFGLLVRHWLS